MIPLVNPGTSRMNLSSKALYIFLERIMTDALCNRNMVHLTFDTLSPTFGLLMLSMDWLEMAHS